MGDGARSVAADLEVSERVAALEGEVAGLLRRLDAIAKGRPNAAAENLPEASVSLVPPPPGLPYPAAWRNLKKEQIRHLWKDLARWLDWLIEAYRLPPRPWADWWLTPGVCEELACLRNWHRDLVDTAVADPPPPEDATDPQYVAEWFRQEQALRIERAHSHAEWHEALWQVVARLAGATVEQKPLLIRESESTTRTTSQRIDEAKRRADVFAEWLTKPEVTRPVREEVKRAPRIAARAKPVASDTVMPSMA